MNILLLPGLNNSGPSHWQSLWEKKYPQALRVQQQDWDQPERHAWLAALSEAVNQVDGSAVLVAHSLGCALAAWWLSLGMPGVEHKDKIKAALLVAPPDVERAEFPAKSFAPMPKTRLGINTLVVASDNDPWCDLAVSREWASSWGAEFHCIGAKGHINGDSGLGGWEQGQHWLAGLLGKP
ncbi:alpha/beta hydrolase [Undibacterium sp. Jales W-56]|uniref:RBBP9/YdeN family alpha/beta hydrolase n=1 Tax=Undibacterium sp. Jales W-56 TaxID=2897325 RepID=UPI0021D2F03D|nr:alpha/beta hydrolase [Undibacterium sp. Jales W-56]MCU6434352.1 alpha/beta hydrolase [Undibacterium sp. Jales W-56]